jgi:hypothetical protein
MPNLRAPTGSLAAPKRLSGETRGLLDGAFRSQSDDQRAQQYRSLWQVGAPLLLFPLYTFALATLWLIASGTITSSAAWIVLALSAAAALFTNRLLFAESWGFASVISVALAALAFLLSLLLYDTSIDGQHYHFQAIYAFANGWNPYWGTATPPVIADPITLWAVHYPRATWVFSANLIAAGFPLATVKAVNILLLFASAPLVAGTLFRFGFSWTIAWLLTAVAVFNPIILSQLYTGMNDGLFALCILLFMASLAVWIRFSDKAALVAALAAMAFGLNLKFSALPIFAILAAAVCVGAYLYRGWRPALGVAAVLFMTACIAVGVLGWSPYVQNYLYFGHIFYPIMGSSPVDIMVDNTPEVLAKLSAPERLLYSLFAETHAGYASAAGLKIPFLMTAAELRAAGGVDVRIAGFGPWFSGIVLLTLACVAALLFSGSGRRTPAAWSLLLVAAVFLVSVIAMPQNWWARYVPQLWFIPVCIAAAAIAIRHRPIQLLGGAIVVAMLINAAIVGSSGLWLAGKRTAAAAAQIAEMARTPQRYCVYPDMIQSRVYLMREAGIDVRAVPESDRSCSSPREIEGYGPDRFGGRICACPS